MAQDPSPRPRIRRKLLVTGALSTGAVIAAGSCGDLPLPSNPKGSFYDAGVAEPDANDDAGAPVESDDGGAVAPPAEPK
jgi:hypothetical protein